MTVKGYGDRIAERMAQVVGQGPKIEAYRDDELTQEARDLVLEVRAAAGAGPMGEVPEYMRLLVKHPEYFKCSMESGAVIFRGRISARDREIAVLRNGWLCGAPFEWGEHVHIAKRYGLTDEEVERTTVGSTAPGWTEHEAAILRGVEELLSDFAVSDETYATLAKTWDEAQLIEFPAMVGAYITTALIQNTLRARLADDNPGLTRR